MSGVAISQTRMIKIFGGIPLVRDDPFVVATGKAVLQKKCYVTFFHNLHLSGFFSFLVRIYF